MQFEAKPGDELFSVATGRLSIFKKASRKAVDYMGSLEGLMGVHIVDDGRMLWLFDSLNHAKQARNLARSKGIVCGTNICRFVVAPDGVPEVDLEWMCEHCDTDAS